jgi:endonuclease I
MTRALPSQALAGLALLVLAPVAAAQIPSGYYDTVDTSSPGALRATLHAVIDDHVRYPYTSSGTDTWDILRLAQEDPSNSSRILDVYKNASYSKGSGSTVYNREHTWPHSYGFQGNTGSSPYTDCHQLWLCDSQYNSGRDNDPFGVCNASCNEWTTHSNGGMGGGSGSYPGNSNWQSGSGTSAVWQVWSGRRGDVARSLLYMDVRYEGGQHSNGSHEPDLVLTDSTGLIFTGNTTGTAYMGRLSTLLAWHAADPPDQFERDRNDVVHSFQENRNPFVDHPEWVDCIWGGVCQAPPTEPTLTADVPSLDLAAGGVQTLSLSASGYAGKLYLVIGSASGTEPGLPGDPGLPLNWDFYTTFLVNSPNTLIAGSLGFFDPSGNSAAAFQLAGGALDGSFAGLVLNHAYVVIDFPGTEAVVDVSNAEPLLFTLLPATGGLVINEVDYDQPSTDTAEFVELYNAGASPVSLAGLTLELHNGSTSTVYDTIDLSGAGATLPAGGYLVIGAASVTSSLPQGVLSITPGSFSVQNGAPDGMLLLDGSTVLDGLSYEGTMSGVGEGSAGGTDSNVTPGVSLSRSPNGVDTDDNGADFAVASSTPGAPTP